MLKVPVLPAELSGEEVHGCVMEAHWEVSSAVSPTCQLDAVEAKRGKNKKSTGGIKRDGPSYPAVSLRTLTVTGKAYHLDGWKTI